MKRKDFWPLLIITLASGFVALLISGAIFQTTNHNLRAPNTQVINSGLPDVRNNSDYNSIFYQGAVDPAQPVQIGGGGNSSPF